MVKNPRMQIVWLFIAFCTIAANTLAQGFENTDHEVLEIVDSIDLGHYPAQVQAQMTLPGTKHSATALRRPTARTVAVVSVSGWTTSGRIQRTSDGLPCALENNATTVAGELILTQNNPPSTPPTQCRNANKMEVTPPTAPAKAMTWTW